MIAKKELFPGRIQADQILVHQCAIRRFQSRHGQQFQELRNLRNSVMAAIDVRPSMWRLLSNQRDRHFALLDIMHVLNTRNGRAALREGALMPFEDAMQMPQLAAFTALHEESAREVLDLLLANLDFIDGLVETCRIFEIYSVLAVSVRVDALELVKRYYHTYHRARNCSRIENYSDVAEADTRWAFMLETDEATDDLALLLGTGVITPYFRGAGIDIFDDDANDVVLNNTKQNDGIYLRIKIGDEAPHQIDAALIYLREALLGKARDKGFARANYARRRFDESNFVNGLRHPLFFDVKRGSYLAPLMGLACWDEKESGATVDKVCFKVVADAEGYRLDNKLQGTVYEVDTVKKHYQHIAAAIKAPLAKKAGRLDVFLAGVTDGPAF
ncbi:hypothetical protein CSQ91_05020 [Janthinobacterium sp. BJB301]|nr:hypothetical protein CSQ91_05020 [Janthinobacterium sp. BJB301]